MTLEERNNLLDAAKGLLLTGWCQGSYGQTADGEAIESDAPDELAVAVCFCASGAIARVSRSVWEDVLMNRALSGACQAIEYFEGIVEYNDSPGRTKYEVAALFDQAKLQPMPEVTS